MKKLLLLTLAITMFNCSSDDDGSSNTTTEQASQNITVVVNSITPTLDNSGTVDTDFTLTATNNNNFTVEGWIRFKFVAVTVNGNEILQRRDYVNLGCTTLTAGQTCTITGDRIVTSSNGIITDVQIREQEYNVVVVN